MHYIYKINNKNTNLLISKAAHPSFLDIFFALSLRILINQFLLFMLYFHLIFIIIFSLINIIFFKNEVFKCNFMILLLLLYAY